MLTLIFSPSGLAHDATGKLKQSRGHSMGPPDSRSTGGSGRRMLPENAIQRNHSRQHSRPKTLERGGSIRSWTSPSTIEPPARRKSPPPHVAWLKDMYHDRAPMSLRMQTRRTLRSCGHAA